MKNCVNGIIGALILSLLFINCANSVVFAQDAQSYYKTGYEYFSQENYEKAEENYKKAININPDFEKAHYWLGKVYTQMNEYEKAVTEWKAVLRINSQNQYAFWNLINSFKSTSLVKSGNSTDYLNEGNRLINSPQAYLSGDSSFSVDTLLSSIPYFKRAVNIEPKLIEGYYWLAEVYSILGTKITSQFSYLAVENYEKTINTEEAGNTSSFSHSSKYWLAYTRLSELYQNLNLDNKQKELWLRFEKARALPYKMALEEKGYLDYNYPSEIEVSYEDGEKIEYWIYPEKNMTFEVVNGEVLGEKDVMKQIIVEPVDEIKGGDLTSEGETE